MLFNYHCLPELPLCTSAADVGCCSPVPASAGSDNHFSAGHLDEESVPTMSQKNDRNKIKGEENKQCLGEEYREWGGGGLQS